MSTPFFRRAEAELHEWLERNPRARDDQGFTVRLSTSYSTLNRLFFQLYGGHGEAPQLFGNLLDLLWEKWGERDERLRTLDQERLRRGHWYRDGSLAAMQLYADRFAGTLNGIESVLDYFEDLGVNALHLMPILRTPRDHNDGGYAVSDYGAVQESLGTMEDLRSLSRTMHRRGMVLVLDYVLNHTSDEHPWAHAALAGDQVRQDYYIMYPDRAVPDLFEASLPEVFPETAPGNFTWRSEIERWVMTVFHSYQWDLNYSNPRVFLEMAGILLDLANQGVDILRLDAVPYLWKRIGTSSQNLPEAHVLVRLMNACARVSAPGVAFIAEAIVQPREIARYFGEGEWAGRECELAYNASLMVLLWDSIATRRSSLLRSGLRDLPQPPTDSAWLNYVRCHDDIGLGYDEDHLRHQGWDPVQHRDFIVRYFTGEFPGSPARGARFMYNPKNGDARISGTAASLAGIEAALAADEGELLDKAVRRHLAVHAVVLSLDGIPVIYAGDELGMCNDYSYTTEPHLAGDNRWMHRPWISSDHRAGRARAGTVAARIFGAIQTLIRVRRATAALRSNTLPDVINGANPHLLSYVRHGKGGDSVLVVVNFDESPHHVGHDILDPAGFRHGCCDLINGTQYPPGPFTLGGCQFVWLRSTTGPHTG